MKLSHLVGTMIEVPRGALTADEIAQTAGFFGFGTGGLIQTCLGMSRDGSGSFLPPLLAARNRGGILAWMPRLHSPTRPNALCSSV